MCTRMDIEVHKSVRNEIGARDLRQERDWGLVRRVTNEENLASREEISRIALQH